MVFYNCSDGVVIVFHFIIMTYHHVSNQSNTTGVITGSGTGTIPVFNGVLVAWF